MRDSDGQGQGRERRGWSAGRERSVEGRGREGDGEGGRDRMQRTTSRRRPKMSKWEKEEEGSGLWSYSKSKDRQPRTLSSSEPESSPSYSGTTGPGLTPLTTSSTFASSNPYDSTAAKRHDEDHVPLYPEFRSIEEEFDFSTPSSTSASPSTTTPTSNARTTATELPTTFSSPPLMPGLVDSIKDVLGARAKPTAIQALAIRHLVEPLSDSAASRTTEHESVESEAVGQVETKAQTQYRQFLLASETGSGKSIAYLLPLLQSLKQSELSPSSSPSSTHQLRGDNAQRPTPLNPRALILAPTHELSRQLATFGKGLIHNIKLRVMSASRANVPNDGRSSSRNAASAELNVRAGGGRNMSASRMAKAFDHESEEGEFEVSGSSTRGKGRDVDVLVGTPKRLLEMAMGHGWDKEAVRNAEGARGRKWVVGPREVGLEGVEWVVVDEADTLLGVFLLSRILVSKDLF